MNWIKKNPHLVALAVLALGLLTSTGLVIANTQGFDQKFAGALATVVPDNHVPPLDVKTIADAESEALNPQLWTGKGLFVPDRYVIDPVSNMPKKVTDSSFYRDSLTNVPIPNKWFDDHNLKTDDPKVPFGDPDKDGFTNEDEWRGTSATPGANSTDPNKATSHPAYYTKLFLKAYNEVSFRLKFQAYDGDPKKQKPEQMDYQINTLDLRQPSVFLKLGEMVPKTRFKLDKFEYKEIYNPKIQGTDDVSELTLRDTESDETIVLVLNKIINSPDSYAVFIYEWPDPPITFPVKKLQKFVLVPEKDKYYKLLAISKNQASVETPSGDKITILPDPRLPAVP